MFAMLRLAALLVTIASSGFADDDKPDIAIVEKRALAFLAREVPAWSVEHKCFSCHNNGDGARALYTARRFGRKVDDKALAVTTDWLNRPQDWKNNHGDPAFSDKTLATLQFAVALAAADDAVDVRFESLHAAAKIVAGLQQPDGSWKIEGPDAIGSSVTWGRALTTALSWHVLRRADTRHRAIRLIRREDPGARLFEQELSRADQWLRTVKVESVLDAGAVLIGLGHYEDKPATAQRAKCLDIIRKGESATGGWGPYVTSSPEPFDTAVVLLGLDASPTTEETKKWIERGRASLISTQLPEGNWPETTRPPGAGSYSQRISTTAWATQALLTR